jgi:hypothetical protein
VIAMPRTIWLAFVCLLFLSALFALRTSTGARTIVGSTAAAPPSAIDDGPPLAKSDRLPSLDLGRTEAKASVRTVKIAPAQPEAKAPPKTLDAHHAASERKEVMSWHWHAGSKITKRTTIVGQPKSEGEQ